MARGSRSRASRAERRSHRERAASALEHGLPVPTEPKRALNTGSSSPQSSTPPAPFGSLRPGSSNPRMPLAVKLLALGLGLLGLVYGLTLLRDRDAGSEPALVPPVPAPVK